LTPSDRTPLQSSADVGLDRQSKAVINTQRMICANQMMLRETLASQGRAAVIVDWLPWNHTFGGITISG